MYLVPAVRFQHGQLECVGVFPIVSRVWQVSSRVDATLLSLFLKHLQDRLAAVEPGFQAVGFLAHRQLASTTRQSDPCGLNMPGYPRKKTSLVVWWVKNYQKLLEIAALGLLFCWSMTPWSEILLPNGLEPQKEG